MCCLHTLPQKPAQHNHSNNRKRVFKHKIMDLNVEFCDETHVIEVALADTVEDMRRKVASAVGLPEDSFGMSFGDEAMGEGADMTQLSAGDTIVVTTESKKQQAIAALRALGETDLTPSRLRDVQNGKNVKVACLLLQAEVTTVITDGFFSYSASVTQLDLSSGVSTVTRIEGYFLTECRSLTSVDLSSLNSLEYIGDNFLYNCASLTSLDLSSLENVIHIGRRFLRECPSLETIRLSGCSAVVSRAVRNANLMKFVVDTRPKRKRDKSPEEDCKRLRVSQ